MFDKKIYKNDSNIGTFLSITFVIIPPLLIIESNNTSIIKIVIYDLIMVCFTYFAHISDCWDVHLYEDKIVFRNEWNFLWKNEWEFPLKSILLVEMKVVPKKGPCIYLITNERDIGFFSIGYQRTRELTEELRKQKVRVKSQLE